jgi:hypothetical protein
MTRRQFLETSLAAAGFAQIGATSRADDPSPVPPAKFILGAPLTHSDWMLKSNIQWGA